MRLTRTFPLLAVLALPVCGLTVADPAASSQKPSQNTDDLYELGRNLFDQYAPEDVKRDYEFPSKQQWNDFIVKLQRTMQGNSLKDVAALEPQAKMALQFLDTVPEGKELADWLRERLDMIEAAKQLAKYQQPGQTPPKMLPPLRPPPLVTPGAPSIPNYDFWLERVRNRPAPEGAADLMPVLRKAFALEGVPTELVWLAEVESTFNPSARSPSGAKGLFQLMPDTAKGLGLSTWMPDERTHPEKCARAAARYLYQLHAQFGDWPLALAAYNAGSGTVRRLLEKKGAKSFHDIASSLPVETRLYVPKVLATVSVRTGATPEKLAMMDRRM